MGVFEMFSSSSADKKSHSLISLSDSNINGKEGRLTVIKSDTLPNPNPNNYKILRHKTVGKFLLIEIKYLDCTNYEGRKIIVFECSLKDLKEQKLIDPHFSDNENFISPTARFQPTEQGWKLGLIFCKLINNNL